MPLSLSYVEASHSISTTEWSLSGNSAGVLAQTAGGLYSLFLDTSAMTGFADSFELRLYEKILTADAAIVNWVVRIGYGVTLPGAIMPNIPLGVGWDFTLKKIAGTDRTFKWRIARVS